MCIVFLIIHYTVYTSFGFKAYTFRHSFLPPLNPWEALKEFCFKTINVTTFKVQSFVKVFPSGTRALKNSHFAETGVNVPILLPGTWDWRCFHLSTFTYCDRRPSKLYFWRTAELNTKVWLCSEISSRY